MTHRNIYLKYKTNSFQVKIKQLLHKHTSRSVISSSSRFFVSAYMPSRPARDCWYVCRSMSMSFFVSWTGVTLYNEWGLSELLKYLETKLRWFKGYRFGTNVFLCLFCKPRTVRDFENVSLVKEQQNNIKIIWKTF